MREIFDRLKLVELLHFVDETFQVSQLSKVNEFMNIELFECMCAFDLKGANALAINIYGAICKDLGIFS